MLRLINGFISSFEINEDNHWQIQYRLRIQSPLSRCDLRQNFRIFQQQNILTISDTLLRENGVTNWVPVLYENHPPREFCVQYGESDLVFLSRIWAEEGIFFYDNVNSDRSDQIITLCDNVEGLNQLNDVLPFISFTSAENVIECICEFHYEANVRPSSVLSKDYTFKAPGWLGQYNHKGEYRMKSTSLRINIIRT